MKKINTDALEKMAKDKNIDKDKIEQIANGYKGKSENELMDELIKVGKNLQGKEEVVSKLKAFLDEDQRKKIDNIMDKISQAEVQNKIESKKLNSKKSTSSKKGEPEVDSKPPKKTKSSKTKPSQQTQEDKTPTKKTKKVVKKVKKSSTNTDNN
ncbi:MAG: hypothetical protein IJ086_07305 [Clostridium sp.]|nr:hypothetical protein [Clostridium sp.]